MEVSHQSNSAASSHGASEKTYGWCSVCNVSVEGDKSSEHFESRTHLNRCLQKGFGISLVPTSGIKEGERSSSWCSVCNHALESLSAAQEHYNSRSHLNKCLQRGIGIPLTHPGAMPMMMPPPSLHPRSQGCSAGLGSLKTGADNFRPGSLTVQNIRPRISFNYPAADKRPRIFKDGGSSSSGYRQEMRIPETYNQYDNSWQSHTTATKNTWPYCDQTFQPVNILSPHCNSSAHLDMKMLKQGQYTQSGYQSQAAVNNMDRGLVQTHAFPFTMQTNIQDQYRNGGQGQGQQNQNPTIQHYGAKEWGRFNRSGQFFS